MAIKQDDDGIGTSNGRERRDMRDDGGPLFEPLVPIRLDLVVEGKHVTETFTWNMLESAMTPRQFATMLALDLGLGDSSVDALTLSMKEQIDAFVPPKRPSGVGMSGVSGESRQVVRLNLRMGRVVLRDQFEWDINARDNCPESFARQLCSELGLGSAYAPAVAHAVREQLNDLAEYSDKRAARAQIDTRNVLRMPEDTALWEPQVECLSMEEQERLERKEKREARLQRRNRGKADVFAMPVSVSPSGTGNPNGSYRRDLAGDGPETYGNSYGRKAGRARRR